MPIGSYSSFRDVMRQILMHSPKSILDLGIGHGINGAGVRNWLNVGWKPNYKDTRLVGVEGYEDYLSPLWSCYDEVLCKPIQDYLKSYIETFDCILMTDVIEHFEKNEGLAIVDQCLSRLNKGGILLISTPAVWIEQGDAYGNEFERHKSFWSFVDFFHYGYSFEVIKDGSVDDMGYMMLVVKIRKP